jgi:hypothetical protein
MLGQVCEIKSESKRVPEFAAQSLLKSPTATIRDVYCQGICRHQSAEECATATELVFRIAAFMCVILGLIRP